MFEVPKSVMIYIMPTFDCGIAILFFYMAIRLTKDWGFGGRRELLLLGHRVSMFLGSLAFAYHAYDIYDDPVRHGLTFSNFILHFIVVIIALYASVRMTIAENKQYPHKNGDVFAGPFRRRGLT
jgi:hypothetical protein